MTFCKVPSCCTCNVARPAILDQENTPQLLVVLVIKFQLRKVMAIVVLRQEDQLHQPGMHHQEHQHVHCSMPCIVELLLLNRPWDRSADGMTLQDLEGGDFIDTHDPDALFCQPGRIPIAPKDLLRSLFELGIQAGRLPIAGAMRLQIDSTQDLPHGPWADVRHNPIRHRLTHRSSLDQ